MDLDKIAIAAVSFLTGLANGAMVGIVFREKLGIPGGIGEGIVTAACGAPADGKTVLCANLWTAEGLIFLLGMSTMLGSITNNSFAYLLGVVMGLFLVLASGRTPLF